MEEPRSEEGHVEPFVFPCQTLLARTYGKACSPLATNPVDVVSPLPASGGAAACDGEEEGSDESAAGMSEDNSVVNHTYTWAYFGLSVSQTSELNDDIERALETEAEGNAAPISDEFLDKAVEKLNNVVPKKYDWSTRMPTIYKVPDEFKGGVGDHKDYRPVLVYLGFCLRTGYDRRECKLEEYKWCCVRQLIGQLHGQDKAREVLLSCMQSMNRLLPEVLASYSQHIKVINNDEMVEQMLLDSCLILLLLLWYAPSSAKRWNGDVGWIQTFGHHGRWQSISRDMLLLENQIPFFVVKELFELLKIEGESEELLFTGSLDLLGCPSLEMHDLVETERNKVQHLLHLFYLSVGFPHEGRPPHHKREEVERNKVQHLLHLLYLFLGFPDGSRPPHHECESLPELTRWIPSAKELEEAGVRFRKRSNADSFLDIRFDYRHGILEIPPLELYDSSSALFRNLIAFEQTYPKTERDISTYIDFMDCLVNTPEDMRILNLRGILVNNMNSEQDTSRFFSQLCVAMVIRRKNYLAGLMQDISKYKDSRRHKWRAALVRNYFSNPWKTMSVFAAMLLLILTFLQTVFTIYPYYNHSQRG